jgi:hypothetical protein
VFEALTALGFWYDCSIEDGWQPEAAGTNFTWPYTLDGGSPGNEMLARQGLKRPITAHAGLWEMPAHPVIVPPDDQCRSYGVEPGLRAKLKTVAAWFDEGTGKVTGFDYNLWVTFEMTKAEVLATLKYSLDLRLAGNRAPFMLGAHSDCYATDYADAPNANVRERQQAIEEFLDYALARPEVRVASLKQVLDWVRNPVPVG